MFQVLTNNTQRTARLSQHVNYCAKNKYQSSIYFEDMT